MGFVTKKKYFGSSIDVEFIRVADEFRVKTGLTRKDLIIGAIKEYMEKRNESCAELKRPPTAPKIPIKNRVLELVSEKGISELALVSRLEKEYSPSEIYDFGKILVELLGAGYVLRKGLRLFRNRNL